MRIIEEFRDRSRVATRFMAAVALWGLFCLAATESTAADLRVRFVTYNVNFNTAEMDVQADVSAIEGSADILSFQETKTVRIDPMLDSSWTVYQVAKGYPGEKNEALAIRNSICSRVLDHGVKFILDNHGEKMNDRYIAWADVELINGQILRVMSLHFPPGRFQYLQPIMADNFVDYMEATPYPVVVGGDWNYKVNDDPYDLRQRTGLVPSGINIIGFYYNDQVANRVSTKRLKGLNLHSDHAAVQMVLDVAGQGSGVGDWNLY